MIRKATLALALFGLAVAARAQEQTFVAIGTATYSGVTVTTGTAVRIDNWNLGVVQMLTNRTEIAIVVPTGGQTIWWGFDSNVSTDSTKGSFGHELLAGGVNNPAAGTGIAVWAKAANAAGVNGQRIHVQQAGPKAFKAN